uniref:Uncharacterized protein n=1 Tax=Oryza meridionalis TaxID=40149 RepID=A0A0E0BXT6_9ORYZ
MFSLLDAREASEPIRGSQAPTATWTDLGTTTPPRSSRRADDAERARAGSATSRSWSNRDGQILLPVFNLSSSSSRLEIRGHDDAWWETGNDVHARTQGKFQ